MKVGSSLPLSLKVAQRQSRENDHFVQPIFFREAPTSSNVEDPDPGTRLLKKREIHKFERPSTKAFSNKPEPARLA